MDYSALLKALEQASLFDLWRLNAAIGRALDDPTRVAAVRRQLHPGQDIRYFAADENREVAATIIQLKRTRALVRNHHDGRNWNIPFYMINLEGVETVIRSTGDRRKINRESLRVGDRVAYLDRGNRERYGQVTKLNPKTATVRLPSGDEWRIPYGLLFSVIDGVQPDDADEGAGRLLEGEILPSQGDS